MSELPVRSFLQALQSAGERLKSHGPASQPARDALVALAQAAQVLTTAGPEVVLTLSDGALYFGPKMLPHATVEFNGMIGGMSRMGIDSVTVTRDAHPGDLADLAGVISGTSGDLPVGGTVRLNERPIAESDLDRSPVSGLRKTYSASLDTLRDLGAGGRLDMGQVIGIVEGFIGSSAASSLMMATVRNYDETTYYHSVNVCLLSMTIGNGIGLGDDDLRHLAAGALLHDLGRVLLGEAALSKKGSLTSEDWAQVRLHPQEGAQAILAASGPGQEIAAAIALEHHARMDGDGYPDLMGRTPHPFSRIVAIADAYDAITSRRPHRPARTPLEAMRILGEGTGTAFDPAVVTAFLHLMGEYPPGSMFRIESGEVVVVTGGGQGAPPSGLIVRDREGRTLAEPQPVDLDNQKMVGVVLPEDAGIDPAELLEAVEG
ncbi:MAG: HD domain-containing phosphohydrolase [Actinomycetota bacterium]|nr:HD domain-containing protein [Actinomycetota bacterium]